MQFQSPSAVQGPVSAPAGEVVPDDAGDDAAEEDAGAAGEDVAPAAEAVPADAGDEAAEGVAEAAGEVVAPAGGSVAVVGMITGAVAPGAKTLGAVFWPADAEGVATLPLEPALPADAEGVAALPLEPALPPQVPTGGPRLPGSPAYWTESPGLGNWTSTDSLVLHPLPMLATNIGGNEVSRFVKPGVSASASLLPLPLVTVTGAQFMYISRFPILLNHVHASV